MMKVHILKFVILLVLFQVFNFQLFAQSNFLKSVARNELASRGEVYFSFELNSPIQIPFLSRIISISHFEGNRVFAYANESEFVEFEKLNLAYRVETAPSLLETVETSSDIGQLYDWDTYPTYSAYETIMSKFAADYPDICQLVTIGELASGRKLLAVKITDNPTLAENEPEFLYTSSIHGDETAGYMLMLHLIDYLLTNYGKDESVSRLVNNLEIYINPLANPDGTYKGGNNTINGATRFNNANIDLNRNYRDPKAGAHPDGQVWQPETVAFMNFADNHHFTMSANFHGGAEVLNYPWDTWPRMPSDYKWWYDVCRRYADTVHKYVKNYLNDYDKGVTNGYAWYTITGGRQDYMNYFKHCREVTIELSYTKMLAPANFLTNWNYNYRSLLNMMGEALFGLHGTVTDSVSGKPLPAKITMNGFDQDSSEVYTDAVVGDYHRLLKAGNYSVTVASTGYASKSFDLTVEDRKTYIKDVQLAKLTTPLGSDDKQLASQMLIWPNPVTGGKIGVRSPEKITRISISDASGKEIYTADPESLYYAIETDFAPGTIILQIECGKRVITRKLAVIK